PSGVTPVTDQARNRASAEARHREVLGVGPGGEESAAPSPYGASRPVGERISGGRGGRAGAAGGSGTTGGPGAGTPGRSGCRNLAGRRGGSAQRGPTPDRASGAWENV